MKETTYINLTSRELTVVLPSGVYNISAFGGLGGRGGLTVYSLEPGEIGFTHCYLDVELQDGTYYPEVRENVFYIVDADSDHPDRSDILIPGPLLWDMDGRPKGCKGFSFPE